MSKLIYAGEISSITLKQIGDVKKENCKSLIDVIGEIVGKNLSASCVVASINHKNEYRAKINTIHAKVSVTKKEKAGETLQYRNEPKELQMFPYVQLKKSANLYNGKYRGKLYGTIHLSLCPEKINCPDCNGTGLCSNCGGNKQITCTVCDGNLECVQCNGTGIYTCTNCDGNGDCPECDNGWVGCNYCNGSGRINCPDCCGTGNYIDTTCNKCGGSGYYNWDTICRACDGSGRFVVECKRCSGEGTIDCDNCDGDGGWDCEDCHGTGKCSHCHGEGGFTCRACNGSRTCGKCRGKGKIWCTECHGKGLCFNCKGDKLITCPRCGGSGKYQSYKEYIFDEKTSECEKCTLDIENKRFSQINGSKCYEGVLYEMFGKKANIYDVDSALNSIGEHNSTNIKTTLQKWFSVNEDNTNMLGLDTINDDYIKKTCKLYIIPVTLIVLKCNDKFYNLYIVGSNKMLFYDNLPGTISLLRGRISKLFS